MAVNILIIDDNLADLNVLTGILIKRNYKLRRALGPAIALQSLAAKLPDLIITDINMPEMTGYELCHQLKTDPPTQDIPIIFISASDEVLDKKKAFDCGGDDYITKPYHFEEVIMRIENQLKLRQTHQQLQEKNHHLQQTVNSLNQTQASLLEAERAATLGQIVRSITHEMTQPLSFVQANVSYITHCCHDIQSILKVYSAESLATKDVPTEAITDSKLLSQTQKHPPMQLDILNEDIRTIETRADAIMTESTQVQTVITSLNTLFEVGQQSIQNINICHNLNAILRVLQTRLQGDEEQPVIEVMRQYDGDLPTLEIDVNKFNQSLFLILSYTLEQLRKSYPIRKMSQPEKQPKLSIGINQVEKKQLMISISHNGINTAKQLSMLLNQSMLAHTIEPLLETETSLPGLIISYQTIVQPLGGKFICQASNEEGMEMQFLIELPIYSRSVKI